MRIASLFLALFLSFNVSAARITQVAAINLTSSGTRQALSASNVYVTSVVINALAANTGTIYVGDVGVTAANGLVLAKGDSVILTAKTGYLNLKYIYFDGSTTNDDIKISYAVDAEINVVPKPL